MAKTRPRTRREKLEEREETLLNAAHEIFAESGFEGAKMADIARRASVAEGTVYLYFKNKNALLEAVIARFYQRLTDGAQQGVKPLEDTFERLEFLARHHLTRCMEEWHILELMIGLYRRMHDYENRGYKLNKAYVAVFDRVYREGVARGDLRSDTVLWVARDMFYGTLEYTARTLILRAGDKDESETAIEHSLSLLRRGMEARGAANKTGRADLDAIVARLETVAQNMETRS